MTRRTIIPIGPYHPLQEEAEFFQLFVEGETVVDMDVRISYNHRGIEGVSMKRTWDQVPYVVERVCGICSACHPTAYVQAVEDLADIEVPERALYIRSVITELERLHSHLLWLGLAGHFLGYNTVFMWAWKYREPVLDICEELTGNRNNYAMLKVGGVRRDLDESLFPSVLERMDDLDKHLNMLVGAVTDDPVLHARLKGVGILTPEAARAYGALGPTVRASGIPIDVRRDHPYAAYDLVDWDVISVDSCDVYGRAVVRLLECVESVKIIRRCLDQMRPGEIDSGVKEIPPGEGIGHAEAPRGETFHYVRSDGTNRPIRHKARAPTYMNLPTCRATTVGESITDATIILASVDPCYSCTERMGVYDASTGQKALDGKQLIKLSQEKTRQLREEMGE